MLLLLMLIDNPFDAIKAHLQIFPPWSIAKTHKVVARTVKEISPFGRIEIEEDARH